MDKSFLILYAIAVCFCIGILLLLQRTGADINTMIIACMIGVSGIAVLTVFLIDKLFLAEWQSWEQAAISVQNRVLQSIW